jgi:HEPN domain-containing protein
MQNKNLAADYLWRAQKRLKAVQVLYDETAWADVVRESQEIVELSLKALLRHYHIEVPRIHDVSGVLEQESERFPKVIQDQIKEMVRISKQLRRDRELAFYGSEDLTPSEFYTEPDAKDAQSKAGWLVKFLVDNLEF